MARERRKLVDERAVVAVGLTGSIGAGKSTALAMFGACGATVLSADELVHRLYGRADVVAQVAKHFGNKILDAAGGVDRAKLAAAVRSRPGDLRRLEEITHPLVGAEVALLLETAPAGTVVVCEIPLMFENGFEKLFDLVVTIEAGPEVRRNRSVHQFGLEQFAEFEAMQATSQRRSRGSDLVFINDGDLDQLRDFVKQSYEAAKKFNRRG